MSNVTEMNAAQVKAALAAIQNPPKKSVTKKAVTFIEKFRANHGLTGMQCWAPRVDAGSAVQFGRGVEITGQMLEALIPLGFAQDLDNPRKFIFLPVTKEEAKGVEELISEIPAETKEEKKKKKVKKGKKAA